MAVLNKIILQIAHLTLILCLTEICCLKDSNYFDVRCLSKNRFWFMHTQFDCVLKDGTTQCDQLALLSEQKQKCKRCCNSTSTTPMLNSTMTTTATAKKSPSTTPKLLLKTLEPYKNSSDSLTTPIAISTAAAVVLFIIIVLITFKYAKLLGEFSRCERRCERAEGNTLLDVTTHPTQEVDCGKSTGTPKFNFVGIPSHHVAEDCSKLDTVATKNDGKKKHGSLYYFHRN